MTRTIILLQLILLTIPVAHLQAQDVSVLLQQGAVLERSFKDQEALNKYSEVLQKEPSNLTALCKVSQLYSIVGKRQPTKERQKEYYTKGLKYAMLAIKEAPDNAEANFSMAMSKGRIALVSSGEEKIRAIKEVKAYADKCIQLDPQNFKGYHVLGKWYYEVSDLNFVEKWLVKTMYGSLPDATLNDAIKYYEKSRQLNPSFLLNYLELAKAYKRNDEDDKARRLLQQLQVLPATASDDPKIKAIGRKMLDDL